MAPRALLAGLLERDDFGVVQPGVGVEAAAHHFAVAHQHGAHHGVGTGQRPALARQVERFAHVIEGSFFEERFDEFFGVEGQQVFDLFADADVADGQVQLARDGDHDAALGGAVELGEHDAGDAGGFGEFARLLQAVLAGGGVEHQQHFVRRVGDHLAGGAAHLLQLQP